MEKEAVLIFIVIVYWKIPLTWDSIFLIESDELAFNITLSFIKDFKAIAAGKQIRPEGREKGMLWKERNGGK